MNGFVVKCLCYTMFVALIGVINYGFYRVSQDRNAVLQLIVQDIEKPAGMRRLDSREALALSGKEKRDKFILSLATLTDVVIWLTIAGVLQLKKMPTNKFINGVMIASVLWKFFLGI